MELILREIRTLATKITHNERAFKMRQRLNPHHPPEHQAYEQTNFDRMQYSDFSVLKNMYVVHREALLGYEGLTEEDRHNFAALDKCVMDDMEKELLCD